MQKSKRVAFTAEDRVSHKGNIWHVMFEEGGLVKISRDGMSKMVRINQVQKIENLR